MFTVSLNKTFKGHVVMRFLPPGAFHSELFFYILSNFPIRLRFTGGILLKNLNFEFLCVIETL